MVAKRAGMDGENSPKALPFCNMSTFVDIFKKMLGSIIASRKEPNTDRFYRIIGR